MEFTAKQIGELLNGKIEGDVNVTVNSISSVFEAAKLLFLNY